MKPKRKSKRKPVGFSLDLVSPLTPNECRKRLNQAADQARKPTHYIGFSTTGEFSIEQRSRLPIWIRLDSIGGYYTVRFEGTLQAVTQGTWVRGHITKPTAQRIRLERWLVKLGFAAFILLLVYSLASSDGQVPADQATNAIWLFGSLGFIQLLFSWHGQLITENAQQLVSWLHEALVVPPDPIEKITLSPINLDRLYPVERRTLSHNEPLENRLYTGLLKVTLWLIVILLAVAAGR